MKTLVLLFLVLFTYNTYSQNELDDIAIANITYKNSKKELESLYNEILNLYASKPIFIKKLKESQKAWETYSTLTLEIRYPDYNPHKDQGDYNLCFADEINNFTQKRIDELRVWITGADLEFEFYDCRGSIRITDFENPNPDNEPVIVFYYSKETNELEYNFNIRFDYVVFGYQKPDVTSEKLVLFSIFTKDVENNPNKCKYGSYYDASTLENFELEFDSIIGDFVKIDLVNNKNVLDSVFIEKKFFSFTEY